MSINLRMRWTVIAAAIGLCAEGLGSAFIGPGADVTLIATVWGAMIATLAVQADVKMDKSTAVKLATAILMSLGAFAGGIKLAIQAFSYTGVGTVPAMIANGGLNGIVTYLTGMSIARILVERGAMDSGEAFVRAVLSSVLVVLGIKDDDSSAA